MERASMVGSPAKSTVDSASQTAHAGYVRPDPAHLTSCSGNRRSREGTRSEPDVCSGRYVGFVAKRRQAEVFHVWSNVNVSLCPRGDLAGSR